MLAGENRIFVGVDSALNVRECGAVKRATHDRHPYWSTYNGEVMRLTVPANSVALNAVALYVRSCALRAADKVTPGSQDAKGRDAWQANERHAGGASQGHE